jgi:hypothetical protein
MQLHTPLLALGFQCDRASMAKTRKIGDMTQVIGADDAIDVLFVTEDTVLTESWYVICTRVCSEMKHERVL